MIMYVLIQRTFSITFTIAKSFQIWKKIYYKRNFLKISNCIYWNRSVKTAIFISNTFKNMSSS
jgi:hypothetical protein